MHTKEEKLAAFERLLDILDTLREQCPWDRKQTNESLRPNTIEEVYELCDALIEDHPDHIAEELGDVIMHILFYSRMADEKGQFDIADVLQRESDKLVFRHPHIYGEEKVENEADVLKNWEQLKLKEKADKTVLEGVPASLPSIIKAYRIQDKARNVGFDWRERGDVWQKVNEELSELHQAMENESHERAEEELGDFLFSVINAARLYKLNPDNALERTNRKFINRFSYVEQAARKQGRDIKDLSLEEMDALWNQAKTINQ